MADTEDDLYAIDDAAEFGSGKSGGKKKFLLVFLTILVLGAGGAGLHVSGLLEFDKKLFAQSDKPAAPPPPTKSVYIDLPDMLVNLNSVASKPHFLKFKASLELDSDVDITVLIPLRPRIIDKFQIYVRELRLDDLRANGGLKILREELLAQINEVIKPVRATNVLFRNLLVQ